MSPTSVVVLTGAGISADSGVATFRGAGGLWEGQRVEDVATPEAWVRQPDVVWRFYQKRRAALASVEPNAAHVALAEFAGALAERGVDFTLISQNVDDLHQRAGSVVLSMHGALERLRCEACGAVIHDLERFDPEAFIACEACGFERLRPDIVWFGELPRHLDAIEDALGRCTHFVAVGTSGEVYPAAGFLHEARLRGAETWIVSLEPPSNRHPEDRYVGGRAAEVLPGLCSEWLAAW